MSDSKRNQELTESLRANSANALVDKLEREFEARGRAAQMTLAFPAFAPFSTVIPIARETDPDTSHDAGEEHTRSGSRAFWQAVLLSLIVRYPGQCSGRIGEFIKDYDSRNVASKRLPDLRAQGYARNELKAATGRQEYVTVTWEPTGKEGRIWLPTKKGIALASTLPNPFQFPDLIRTAAERHAYREQIRKNTRNRLQIKKLIESGDFPLIDL
jgi:hypothetical protein